MEKIKGYQNTYPLSKKEGLLKKVSIFDSLKLNRLK